jgi:FAD synthetase
MSKRVVEKPIRVMVFGTFDGLHLGHVNFFKQARTLAKRCFLIVSIARDKNVFKIKGEYPDKKEEQRKKLIQKSGLADRIILAGKSKYLSHILKEKPDIIALGYDQKAYVPELKKDLKNKGIFIKMARLKPYKEKIYKNHLLKKRG